jgi:C-terminal processing protease CtpA/Prc
MAGVVGADVLKQFDLTFDHTHRRIIFEKNRNYGTPDTFDRAGLWLGLDGRSFVVIDVIKGGPAAEAGIKVGDHVLAIDGKRVGQLDLLATRLKFKNDPPNERVRLTVLSGNEQREVVIVLRDLV